jgi:hypothetical protein
MEPALILTAHRANFRCSSFQARRSGQCNTSNTTHFIATWLSGWERPQRALQEHL